MYTQQHKMLENAEALQQFYVSVFKQHVRDEPPKAAPLPEVWHWIASQSLTLAEVVTIHLLPIAAGGIETVRIMSLFVPAPICFSRAYVRLCGCGCVCGCVGGVCACMCAGIIM